MSAPVVKWQPTDEEDEFEAKVGRLTLTVSGPVDYPGLDSWFWQVWAKPTDPDGCRGTGRVATKEEAMAEAVRHLDPKVQRAWRRKNA